MGTPVEVRVSYFPNWHASGAEGPYRVAPNLMVVVPTSHDVTLHYGSTGADKAGELITLAAVAGLFVLGVLACAVEVVAIFSRSAAPEQGPAMTRTLPMFPLSTVLFPHAPLPLHVFESRYRRLMADCLDDDGSFGVVLIARGPEVGGGDQRVEVGTAARIDHVNRLDDGRMLVMARGLPDLGVDRWLRDEPVPAWPWCRTSRRSGPAPATGRRWPPPRAPSADCGRSSPSWGTFPPSLMTSRSAVVTRRPPGTSVSWPPSPHRPASVCSGRARR